MTLKIYWRHQADGLVKGKMQLMSVYFLTNQRVFLPGGQVQGRVVQTVHEISQAGYVYLVLHHLEQQHVQSRVKPLFVFQEIIEEGNKLTAATGTRISTKSPAKACLMSLSLTSRKYWAHSWPKESINIRNWLSKGDNCRDKEIKTLVLPAWTEKKPQSLQRDTF